LDGDREEGRSNKENEKKKRKTIKLFDEKRTRVALARAHLYESTGAQNSVAG